MSRNLIEGRVCTEIIEPVSSDFNRVMDCSQINLRVELYAEEVVCNAKSLDGRKFTLHQDASRREFFNHIIMPIVVIALRKITTHNRVEPVDSMIADLSCAQSVADDSCAERPGQHLSPKTYSKY